MDRIDGERLTPDSTRSVEFEALGIEAAAIDQAMLPPIAPAGGAAAAPPAAIDHAADALDLINFAVEAITPLYPSLRPIYSPDVCARLAETGGRLLAKYDLNILALAAQFEPELRFAMVAIPLIAPTVLAIRTDRAAAARAAAAPTIPRSASEAAPASAGAAEAAPEPPPAENPLSRFGQ